MRTKPFSYPFALALVLSSSMAYSNTVCFQNGGVCNSASTTCTIGGKAMASNASQYSCVVNSGTPLLTSADYTSFIGYLVGSFGVGIFLGAQLRVFRVAAGKV